MLSWSDWNWDQKVSEQVAKEQRKKQPALRTLEKERRATALAACPSWGPLRCPCSSWDDCADDSSLVWLVLCPPSRELVLLGYVASHWVVDPRPGPENAVAHELAVLDMANCHSTGRAFH